MTAGISTARLSLPLPTIERCASPLLRRMTWPHSLSKSGQTHQFGDARSPEAGSLLEFDERTGPPRHVATGWQLGRRARQTLRPGRRGRLERCFRLASS
jgi:hypothetical protein